MSSIETAAAPGVADSFRMVEEPTSSFRQFALTPPSWIMAAVGASWLAGCMYVNVYARHQDPPTELSWGIAIWLSLYWVLKLVLKRRSMQSTAQRPIVDRIRWWSIPSMLLCGLISVHFDLPLRLAFDVSRPAMNVAASGVITNTAPSGPRMTGLFSILAISTYHGHVRVLTSTNPDQGFIFVNGSSPDATSVKSGNMDLGGGWYLLDGSC